MAEELIKAELSCEYCKEPFTASWSAIRKGKKYCSQTCGNRARQVQVLRVCDYCGKDCWVYKINVDRGMGRYCSAACSKKANRTIKVIEACENCGAEMIVPVTGKRRTKYCSRKCYDARRSDAKVKVECETCGKDFDLGRSARRRRRFCSRTCSGKAHSGTKANSFKHGGRTVKARKDRMKRLAINGCAFCSWNEAPCDVHHIVAIKDGGSDSFSNLIVLCPNHHRLADRGSITVLELLQQWVSVYRDIPELLDELRDVKQTFARLAA
jgi:hypothetical protein